MANVVRANRELEDRARFGLGTDDQDDDVTEVPLTAEGVLSESEVSFDTLVLGDATLVNPASPNSAGYVGYAPFSLAYTRPADESYAAFDGTTTDISYSASFRAEFYPTAVPDQVTQFAPEVSGLVSEAVWGGDAQTDFAYVYGLSGTASSTGSAPITSLIGVFARATPGGNVAGTSGDVEEAVAINASAGPSFGYTGTVTDQIAIKIFNFQSIATATVTNMTGIYVQPAAGSGTAENVKGIYIGTQANEGTVSSWNFYSEGATSKNYFQGEVELDGTLNHDGAAVGFFGAAPAAKPTGVAVDAAGIHAALVTLGLIGA